MKYTESIDIDRPRDEVVAIFEDPNAIPAWQKGFKGMEPLEGEHGRPGSTCLMHYDFGTRKMTLTETIERNDLPGRFVAIYETRGVFNRSDNQFDEVAPGVTRWTAENEFRFSSLMMKIMGALMPGAFRKQSRSMMADFKAFVEEGKRADVAG